MSPQVNLIEILHPKMDILFLALNPPEKSNENAHYFSGSMSFWNVLFDAGLITKRVNSPSTGDDEVFRSNKINLRNKTFGICDLCHDIVQTKSSKVPVNKLRIQRILSLLNNHDVKILCIMHNKVGKAFSKLHGLDRTKRYGLIGRINSTLVYEMPFHNAFISNKKIYYSKLIV
jgi:G:T/U-mismatch repair DNA glycosylase